MSIEYLRHYLIKAEIQGKVPRYHEISFHFSVVPIWGTHRDTTELTRPPHSGAGTGHWLQWWVVQV